MDFKNTVIIMTTNLGSRTSPRAEPGLRSNSDSTTQYEQMKLKVQQELKQHFRPEFLNRIDDTIVFHQLSQEEIVDIVDLMVAHLLS